MALFWVSLGSVLTTSAFIHPSLPEQPLGCLNGQKAFLMKHQLIVFDFDGTLADSFPWVVGKVDQLADRYKFKRVTAWEHDQWREYDAQTIFKHLQVPFWKIPQMVAYMHTLMRQEIQQITPFTGVGQLLSYLAQQETMLGIVSSNSYENVQQVLGMENIRLFAYLECGVSLFGKAAKLRKILRQSRVVPSAAAIYIGDEIRDIEAARAVKMRFGAVAWGYTRLEVLNARLPDEVFLHVQELERLV